MSNTKNANSKTIQIDEELHKKMKIFCSQKQTTLRKFADKVLGDYIEQNNGKMHIVIQDIQVLSEKCIQINSDIHKALKNCSLTTGMTLRTIISIIVLNYFIEKDVK